MIFYFLIFSMFVVLRAERCETLRRRTTGRSCVGRTTGLEGGFICIGLFRSWGKCCADAMNRGVGSVSCLLMRRYS